MEQPFPVHLNLYRFVWLLLHCFSTAAAAVGDDDLLITYMVHSLHLTVRPISCVGEHKPSQVRAQTEVQPIWCILQTIKWLKNNNNNPTSRYSRLILHLAITVVYHLSECFCLTKIASPLISFRLWDHRQ